MHCFVLREMTGHAQSSFRLVGNAGNEPAGEAAPQDNWKALQEAWKPFQVAWKAPWWDCVAVPEDVDDGAGFRTGKGTTHKCFVPRDPCCCNNPFCTTLSPLAAGHRPFHWPAMLGRLARLACNCCEKVPSSQRLCWKRGPCSTTCQCP